MAAARVRRARSARYAVIAARSSARSTLTVALAVFVTLESWTHFFCCIADAGHACTLRSTRCPSAKTQDSDERLDHHWGVMDEAMGGSLSSPTDANVLPSTVWWRQLGHEEPAPETLGCKQGGCSAVVIDLYCDEHETFLPQGGVDLSNSRYGVIVFSAAIVYLAFWVAATYRTAAPLFAVFVLASVIVLSLVMRRLHIARRVALALFFTSVSGVPLLLWLHPGPQRWLVSAAVLATLAVWVAYLSTWGPRQLNVAIPRAVSALCTTLLGLAAAVGLAAVIEALLPEYLAWRSTTIHHWAEYLILVVLAIFLVVVVLTAAWRGASNVRTNVDRPLSIPSEPALVQLRRPKLSRPRRPKRRRRRGIADAMVHTMKAFMTAFASRMMRAARSLLESAANFARRAGHIAVIAAVKVLNGLWVCIVIALRYLSSVAIYAFNLLVRVVANTLTAGWHSGRVTLVPITAAFGAAAALRAAAIADRDYLSTGHLGSAAVLAIAATAAIIALSLLWAAWSGLGLWIAVRSSVRTVRMLSVSGLACLAIGGWLLGLPGTLGHGPIHVGWLTTASTVGFAAAFVWSRYSGRGEEDDEEDGAAALD